MTFSDLMRQYYSPEGMTPVFLEELMVLGNIMGGILPNLSDRQLEMLGMLFNAAYQMGRSSVLSEQLQNLSEYTGRKRWPAKED